MQRFFGGSSGRERLGASCSQERSLALSNSRRVCAAAASRSIGGSNGWLSASPEHAHREISSSDRYQAMWRELALRPRVSTVLRVLCVSERAENSDYQRSLERRAPESCARPGPHASLGFEVRRSTRDGVGLWMKIQFLIVGKSIHINELEWLCGQSAPNWSHFSCYSQITGRSRRLNRTQPLPWLEKVP